jgi:hypothetical protein
MTTKLALFAIAAATAATPVAAQSLSDTHEMRWAPAGKTTPLVSYHPVKRTCAGAPLHLSGKTPHMIAMPACDTAIARAEPAHVVVAHD